MNDNDFQKTIDEDDQKVNPCLLKKKYTPPELIKLSFDKTEGGWIHWWYEDSPWFQS
ncbi:MAG: hypothetical protein GY750_04960 [Lentisphaerae bacterium]|nr:hypothetical protein [Lentisphaerota bacterium]